MDFRALGPLEVDAGGRMLRLGGLKQRAVLARLLLDANRVVAVDSLIGQVCRAIASPGRQHASSGGHRATWSTSTMTSWT